jgi:hypothetical protein
LLEGAGGALVHQYVGVRVPGGQDVAVVVVRERLREISGQDHVAGREGLRGVPG